MFDIAKFFSFVKKNFNRKDVFFGLGLLSLFLITRIIFLDKLPIFSDEGIYIHWARIAWHDASWRFISLTDGRQPLQTWGTIPFLKLFPQNLLFGGRMFSVATGFVSLAGIFSLLFYLFNKKTAFWGVFLYIFTPFFLFYDRIALADSAVNAGFIWILFFSILVIRTLRFDLTLLFGITAGMAMLTKSSVRLFILLSAFAPILVWNKKSEKNIINKTLNYFILFAFVLVIAIVIYNIQRLSPFMHYIEQKNNTFVMPISEFIKSPFAVFWPNLKIIPHYVFSEMGWLTGFLGVIGLILILKKNLSLGLYFSIWLFAPYFVIAGLSRVIFPRYLIFLATLLTIFSAYFLSNLKSKIIKLILLIIFLSISAFYAYGFYFNPSAIPFPEIDRGQYVEGETAGWGAREMMEFAREKSKEKQVIILAEGDFGLIGDVLNVFLKDDDKINIRGFWPLDEKVLLDNQKELKENFVYVVFSQRKEFPNFWPIKLIKKYDKPGNRTAYYLFELTK
ncbi:MAG: glycosyltransferase family 39 protein [Patescibacteria group bacterium]